MVKGRSCDIRFGARALKITTAPAQSTPAPGPRQGAVLAPTGRFLAGAVSDQALRWPLLLPLALSFGAAVYMTVPFEPDWRVVVGVGLPAGAHVDGP